MKTCERCGNLFEPRRGGRPQRFCGEPCKIKFFNDRRFEGKNTGKNSRTHTFTDRQLQVIQGTLLGDGCLISSTTTTNFLYRLSITHGEKQLAYLKWKMRELYPTYDTDEPHKCFSKGRTFYVAGTRWHQTFNDFRLLFYPNGEKVIPLSVIESIDALGLAVWFMDDGSWNPNPRARQACISTDSFPSPMVEAAAEILKSRFGLKSSVYTINAKGSYGRGVYSRLVFLRSGIHDFFDLIKPFIHETMAYKMRDL